MRHKLSVRWTFNFEILDPDWSKLPRSGQIKASDLSFRPCCHRMTNAEIRQRITRLRNSDGPQIQLALPRTQSLPDDTAGPQERTPCSTNNKLDRSCSVNVNPFIKRISEYKTAYLHQTCDVFDIIERPETFSERPLRSPACTSSESDLLRLHWCNTSIDIENNFVRAGKHGFVSQKR